MLKSKWINTILLIIVIILLTLNLMKLNSINTVLDNLPTLEEIDQRIMHWGQHFGSHYSNIK